MHGFSQIAQFGKSFLVLDKCGSTNDAANEWALQGAPEGAVVLAEEQYQGRGRRGEKWVSPRGGIWMTLILRPPTGFEPLHGLPLIGALAVAKSVNTSLGLQARVRWPNDVVIDNRKLSGVLVESKFTGNSLSFALIGIGLNANFHATELEGIVERSTTLLDATGSPVDRAPLIYAILLHFERLYGSVRSGEMSLVLELIRRYDCSRGKNIRVRLRRGTFRGVFLDYESLTGVRVSGNRMSPTTLDTASAISVEYD